MQEDYCNYYVNITGFNEVDSYTMAGYSTETDGFHTAIKDLMRNPKVQKRIAELMDERANSKIIDKTFVVLELKRIVEETKIDKKNYNPQLKALELLGKYVGMFNNEIETKVQEDAGNVAEDIFKKRRDSTLKLHKKEGEDNVTDEKEAL